MEGNIRTIAQGSLSNLSLPRLAGCHDPNKRRLLLIYIHGFMGSGASFQDYPAQVHELLTGLLSESHVVYTRIYPRYKSHGEIQAAVKQFSDWLSPHEAEDLDVVLLGHSLGGILASDVALLQTDEKRPKHRILGLVNFDVPFLGLHPRVIPTGIMGSIPKKDPASEDNLSGGQDPLSLDSAAFEPAPPNPNFDPPFQNDILRVERGFFKGMMHFYNKNKDNISRSIADRLVSSFKFANCVNDFPELLRRHRRLIELENAEYSPERVRFINYYTASTGRISRKGKKKPAEKEKEEKDMQITENTDFSTTTFSQESSQAPSIFSQSEATVSTMSSLTLDSEPLSSSTLSIPATEDANTQKDHLQVEAETTSIASTTPTDQKESPPLADDTSTSLSTSDSGVSSQPSEKKLRKFILLPSHHWKHDSNSHWTPIVMEDMDEVAAHQSMFIPQGANYEHLVGDSVALIEQWVQADLTRRVLQESLD